VIRDAACVSRHSERSALRRDNAYGENVIDRLVTAYIRWCVAHKRLVWVVNAGLSLAVFAFWWVLFGFVVAAIVEVVTVGWTVIGWCRIRARRVSSSLDE
jgi:hypothetical protein